jgi:hypothetical protein
MQHSAAFGHADAGAGAGTGTHAALASSEKATSDRSGINARNEFDTQIMQAFT